VFDFSPGDDLELIVATTRELAARELAPALRRNESARGVAAQARQAYAAVGLDRIELPDVVGGAGLGAVARVLVNEELAAADAGAALALDPLGPALYPLLELRDVEMLRAFAVPLLGDREARALLVTDGDARLEIGDTTISALVPWLPADRVDLLVVLHGDQLLLVREGFALEPLRGAGLHAAGASELRLDGAPIAARRADAAGAARARARARLYMASLLLGVLRQAADFSREYALGREAFGRPIAHHQALAFLIADMRTAVVGARVLLHEAAWRLDQGLDARAAAAAAFVEAIEASRLVGPNAVQILGGHGFMQDHPVEKYMRDARLLGLTLGGVDAARDDAAGALAGSGDVQLSHFASRTKDDGLRRHGL